jgi:hypothetical protein
MCFLAAAPAAPGHAGLLCPAHRRLGVRADYLLAHPPIEVFAPVPAAVVEVRIEREGEGLINMCPLLVFMMFKG